jgi:transcriptional regulator with XRE-family HTH domain
MAAFNMNFQQEIGQKIRALRKKNGLSQAALAGILGVSAQQIHKIEAGKNALSLLHLLVLQAHFSLSLDMFLSPENHLKSKSYIDIRVDWAGLEGHKNCPQVAEYAHEIKRLLQV